MKKSLALSIAIFATMAASADVVNKDVASQYGRDFLDVKTSRSHTVKSIVAETDEWLIVNYAPQGWAVIAADDAAQPILAYSTTGSLNYLTLPDNMRAVLGGYSEQVRRLKAENISSRSAWLQPAGYASRAAGDVVEPLIKVNWNQDYPFNKYCPTKALVGCVAVSMSQAMSVQRYPSQPKGSVSYTSANYGPLSINFDEQRAYNWNNILSGASSYDETARLLYHAGMSVMMGYGTEGSGIPSNEIFRISDALVNNFSYPSTVSYHFRDRYSNAAWEQMVLNELLAGRAVIYNAIDTQGNYGHSFNVDGYDGSGLYHLNWGWGGYGNGYFSLNNLSDAAMNMNYDSGHRIVIGIGSPDSPFTDLSLSDTRIESGNEPGSVVAVILVNGEEPLPEHKLTVRGLYDSSTGGYESVPFVIDGSMLRTTRSFSPTERQIEIILNVSDASGASMSQGFVLTVSEPRSIAQSTRLSVDRQAGTLTFNTKHNVSYTLRNPEGALIGQGQLAPLPTLVIRRDELGKGANTLTLESGNDRHQIVIKN